MKRLHVFGIFAIIAFIAVGLKAQIAPPPLKAGQEITVKGEIVDQYCYMGRENHGQAHRTCSMKCANQGNPLGLLDETKGELYTLAGRADYQATHEVRDELIKRMSDTVTVVGTVVKKGNTQILFVKSVDGKEF